MCSTKPAGWQERYAVDPGRLICVRRLGEGAFGKVFLQEDPVTREKYALKQISKRGIRLTGTEIQIRNERNLHAMVDSAFIVHLHASYRDELFVYMLLEAAGGGCLEDVICSQRRRQMSSKAWAEDAIRGRFPIDLAEFRGFFHVFSIFFRHFSCVFHGISMIFPLVFGAPTRRT